ncbi:hypothetical protein LXA43DRAFT_1095078 [Ganoderma leucocontextum]|nr:hypothetical protein LXA43DRAFT_1095078 [Ganoderma leucocontextum]
MLAGEHPWAPFASEDEWEFAEFLVTSGLSEAKIEKLLHTRMFCDGSAALRGRYRSFHNKRTFLKVINLLPGPRGGWKCIEITVTGNVLDAKGRAMTEKLELWGRNPVEVVAELIGNPRFHGEIKYAPQVVIVEEGEDANRRYEDLSDAEWWERVQGTPGIPKHATIAPVMVASDKTQLSTFSGDKVAWPVYLTIGNIDKSVHRQPTRQAMVLLSYLPVSKLECFRKADRSLEGYRLFHFTMKQLLEPLVEAGTRGVDMVCADGFEHLVFPILACYIADYPEQCLICCNKENRCPTCLVKPTSHGSPVESCYRSSDMLVPLMQNPSANPEQFEEFGVQHIPEPFWLELPHANIFRCITPDLLHQLHKGVFKDHLVKWRRSRMPKKSTHASCWTGNEFREMEKVFIGILIGLHEDPRVLAAARTVLDFIYLAHLPSPTTSTVAELEDTLQHFHQHKQVFIDLDIREHFNIHKLHWMKHYAASIIEFGSCDGVSTEVSERLHIDFAKLGYRASNRKAYLQQMVMWLTRQEKVRWMTGYLQWVASETRRAAGLVPSSAPLATPAHSAPEDTRVFKGVDFEGELADDECEEDAAASGDHIPMDVEPPLTGRLEAALLDAEQLQPDAADLEVDEGNDVVGDDISEDEGDDICFDGTGTREGEDGRDIPPSQIPVRVSLPPSSAYNIQLPPIQNLRFGRYIIARKPTFSQMSGRTIAQTCDAPSFKDALTTYIQRECPNMSQHVDGSLLDYEYGLFKEFRRVMPSLRGAKDDIIAIKHLSIGALRHGLRLHVTVSGGDTGIPVCLKISGSTVELPYIDWTAVGRATSASDESHGAAQEESETESHMTEAARLGFHSSPPRIRDEHDPFSTPQHNRFERAHRPSTVQWNPRWGDDGLPPDREESPSVRRQMLYEQKRVLGYKPEDE